MPCGRGPAGPSHLNTSPSVSRKPHRPMCCFASPRSLGLAVVSWPDLALEAVKGYTPSLCSASVGNQGTSRASTAKSVFNCLRLFLQYLEPSQLHTLAHLALGPLGDAITLTTARLTSTAEAMVRRPPGQFKADSFPFNCKSRIPLEITGQAKHLSLPAIVHKTYANKPPKARNEQGKHHVELNPWPSHSPSGQE